MLISGGFWCAKPPDAAIQFQATPSPDSLVMLWWNVENFFDTIDDPGVRDTEFTPMGSKRWDSGRFWWKTRLIAKGLVAASHGAPPDLIALSEVENASCLSALLSVLPWGWDYWVMHRDGPDPRGIDLALLYRPDRVSLVEADWVRSSHAAREAIVATVQRAGDSASYSQTIMWVHLPSQYRPEPMRRIKAMDGYDVNTPLDSIDWVIGDFNASPDGPLGQWMSVRGWNEALSTGCLGTYVYRGHWERIDQVWCRRHDEAIHVQVIPFGLKEVNGKPSVKRTFQSTRYIGGASDHLILRISHCLSKK